VREEEREEERVEKGGRRERKKGARKRARMTVSSGVAVLSVVVGLSKVETQCRSVGRVAVSQCRRGLCWNVAVARVSVSESRGSTQEKEEKG